MRMQVMMVLPLFASGSSAALSIWSLLVLLQQEMSRSNYENEETDIVSTTSIRQSSDTEQLLSPRHWAHVRNRGDTEEDAEYAGVRRRSFHRIVPENRSNSPLSNYWTYRPPKDDNMQDVGSVIVSQKVPILHLSFSRLHVARIGMD